MASLENRGNGSWRITVSNGYDSKGRKRFLKRTIHVDPAKTELAQRREAEKQAALIEADYQRHLLTDGKKIRFSALAVEYLDVKGIEDTTKAGYKTLLDGRILPALGKKFVQDISPRDIQTFYISLAKATALSGRSKTGKLSGTSQLHYHRCLHAILEYAVQNSIITINPADAVVPPKKDTKEAAFYELEDCAKLLEVLDNLPDLQWRLFYYLSIYTGCRPGEIIALNWSDIIDNVLYIHAGSKRVKGQHGAVRKEKPKTLKSNRKITLTDEIVQMLRQHKKEQAEYRLKFGADWPEPDAVFTGDLGYRLDVSSPTQKFQKILKQNNLKPIRLYDLRHTAASILIKQHVDPREVAARLGHSRTSTTLDIYAHVFQEADAEATATIDDAIKNARKKAK